MHRLVDKMSEISPSFKKNAIPQSWLTSLNCSSEIFQSQRWKTESSFDELKLEERVFGICAAHILSTLGFIWWLTIMRAHINISYV